MLFPFEVGTFERHVNLMALDDGDGSSKVSLMTTTPGIALFASCDVMPTCVS